MIRFAIVLSALALACTPLPGPQPPPPSPDAADAAQPVLDAGTWTPPDSGADPCDLAYLHLVAIGCEPVAPAVGTWPDVCRNGRKHGLFDLTCPNRAANVAAAVKCGVACK